ncbi:MAG: (2Fe-2S) ferredoxin domain-containing protein [Acidimicrobiia bacterium]|nr:(2Fe-2S) ferredoxin domain-containing protein [Acidimicrobiia bacterium]
MEPEERLESISSALSIDTVERHILLCAEPTTPKCAAIEEGAAVWRHLKTRLKAMGLASAPPPWSAKMTKDQEEAEPWPMPPGGGRILRSKVDCLRICEQGPIAVVYPDGVWYHSVSVDVMDRIIDQHLVGGEPVEEFVFARTGG